MSFFLSTNQKTGYNSSLCLTITQYLLNYLQEESYDSSYTSPILQVIERLMASNCQNSGIDWLPFALIILTKKKKFEMLHWILIAFCTNYIFFKVMQGKFHCFKKNRKVLTKIIRWKYFYLLENIWFTNTKFLIAFCTNYLVLLDKNNFENSFSVQGPVTFKLGFFHRKVALLVKIV